MTKQTLVLFLSLFVTACASSSQQTPPRSQKLQAAEAKVDQKLDHPEPPTRLALCQDGSTPMLIDATWECPPPIAVQDALASGTSQDIAAALIGALRRETDLRFRLLDWSDGKLSN